MSQTSDQTTIVISPQNSPLPSQDQQQQQQQGQQQQQQQQQHGWERNKSSTLLVVATLITTLTYQIGSNPPGGFWQDDKPGSDGHKAGSPIMRYKDLRRYCIFLIGAFVGFVDSMLLTFWLLIGLPVRSTRVRWSFVIAYSSLQLTYITAVHGTPLVFDLVTWVVIVSILAIGIGKWNALDEFLGPRVLAFLYGANNNG